MPNTFLTHLQIFGIGLSFGIVGPCLLTCTPILVIYVAGMEKRWAQVFGDTLVFLLGRSTAYIILGILAGMSAGLFKQFISSRAVLFFRPLGGVLSILLGISVFLYKAPPSCPVPLSVPKRMYNIGRLFTLGFALGVTPCAPLLALLFEITLISKSAFEGASYALAFGLGTSVSGLILLGPLGGISGWVSREILKSKNTNLIFRIICSSLLVLLGIAFLL